MALILGPGKKQKYLTFFVSANEMNASKLTHAKNIQKTDRRTEDVAQGEK